jgi:aldehyde dehydrogenase (NAD+)
MTVLEKFKTMEYGPAKEGSSMVEAWIKNHGAKFGHFIDGKWQKGSSGKAFPCHNPATGKKLAQISQGSKTDVDKAYKAARKAQPAWEKLGGHARAKVLYALARLVQKHSRILAVLETMNNGKTIRETRDIDIPLVARHFYHHAGWAQIMAAKLPDQEAVGVVGQVIPWNFPFLMMSWKIAPALAAGNCIVLKPAEYTPLSALMFAELCVEAGLPKGVVNIITGDGKTGAEIVEHDGFNKLAFTGSTGVGRNIRKASAGSGKKLTLELGGKSPYIVFDDADLDGAIEGLVDAIWLNQGEVCCAGSRLLVHEGVADKFYKKLKARMDKLRVGDPLDKCMDMGALVDPVQKKRIEALVAQGVAEGATIYQAKTPIPSEGCFYPPTLLMDVESSNICAREEIFGPVLVGMTFRTQKEAVDLANNTRFGLASSVWTENISKALDVAPKIKAGIVWVNSANMFDAAVGFGGYRESGFGREGGIEGMYEYLKPKFEKTLKDIVPLKLPKKHLLVSASGDAIDRTSKHYIGGKQARPDNGQSLHVTTHDGTPCGEVAFGNYKDVRNAVEAAAAAEGWQCTNAHTKAQIIYYIAENLSYRADEFAKTIKQLTGVSAAKAKMEVDVSIERLFGAAAWADKYDGQVHTPPIRGIAVAMKEAVGNLAIICPDEAPLLGFISLVAPAIAMGNRTIVIPSERYPQLATDFYQVLETSDLPAGVINIITGKKEELAAPLSKHDNVDGVWYHGSAEGSTAVEENSAGNIKRTWVNYGKAYNWFDAEQGGGEHILRHATEVKNIWLPYGDQI